MITGFNTDVKCADKVFHVQTEDKGVNNPLIESLIYVKGAILDSYRTSYHDYLKSQEFRESTLQKILEFQHRQIISSIKRGRFRKGMSLQAFVEGDFVFELKDSKGPGSSFSRTEPEPKIVPVEGEPSPRPGKSEISEKLQTRLPNSNRADETKMSSASRTPQSRPNRIELSLDPMESTELLAEKGIEICIEGSKEFIAGSHVDLTLSVQSRQSRLRLEDVQVIVKIIGTTFSPRLYAGKTDRSGTLHLNFNLPFYSVGSAALILQASTGLGSDEVKYLIKRK
jgi:hypothetical protein